ncbi:MAG: hypothetical protein BWY83_02256 [bacterium ADurb.Bin478]|nr:MAG: hypothetical protein BWY83_02256 [bacterium ADurb.Bin478]
MPRQQAGGGLEIGIAVAELAVRDDVDLVRVQRQGLHPTAGHAAGQQLHRQTLAHGDDEVSSAARAFAGVGDAVQQLFQSGQQILDFVQCVMAQRVVGDDRHHQFTMQLPQIVQQWTNPPLGLQGFTDAFDQMVGHAAHCRQHDDLLRIRRHTNDLRHLLQRFDAAQGRAADFHHDHSKPSRNASSALSTDPPAAPRIRLLESAIILMTCFSTSSRPTATVIPCARTGSPSITSRLG